MHHQLVRFLLVGIASFLLDVAVMSTLIYGLGLVESGSGVLLSRVAAWASATWASAVD